MGVVDYLWVNGVLLSETRDGVESDYIADPLGSTAALMSTTGAITDTFTYWPYGQLRSHVGSSTTPYRYGGTLGYYTDGTSGRVTTDARIYESALTRWLTVDPLWPYEYAYVYVNADPTNRMDPSGLGGPGPNKICLGPYVKGLDRNRKPIFVNYPPRTPPKAIPKKRAPIKGKPQCSSGGEQCSNMCAFLGENTPWPTPGQSNNIAAACVACCMETVKISKTFCKDYMCCHNACMAIINSPTKPTNGSGLLPCNCPGND